MEFYAKSINKDGVHETVGQHLQSVAILASQYGAVFGQGEQAKLCGQLHDFGKYSQTFQNVLNGTQSGIDHAIAGAVLLYSYQRAAYRPIIEAIAAHHSHLISYEALEPFLQTILKSDSETTTLCGKKAALTGAAAYQEAGKWFCEDFSEFRLPKPKGFLPEHLAENSLAYMLYTRMLFSCLVDADYTASAGKCIDERAGISAALCLEKLYAYCETLRKHSHSNADLNRYRNRLFDRCGEAGEQEEGLFTLTAPTGTGKTLALLHFALRHCQFTKKRRIIVVLPFLSLIEQSTSVYQNIIPQVLEDHSQSGLSEEFREHTERWDEPFIVTTSVRFFETLFASSPTDCRKIHNICDSVILFDEAQSLPVSLLVPTLKTMQELCNTYRCSVVFSTATQPDYSKLKDISWNARELLPEYPEFYHALQRTTIQWKIDQPMPLENIAQEMAKERNTCAILNLRAHARKLYRLLREHCAEEEVYLLSTDLCPVHRTKLIEKIRERQKKKLPCRVVATQCIEAGVDLDFDKLYRALAPLEAIIQAAGRCNRNGKNKNSAVIVFLPEEEGRLYPDDHYENAATIVRTLQETGDLNIHDPDCIRQYYGHLYGAFRGNDISRKLETYIKQREYQKVRETYRLIDQKGVSVIVPYHEKIELYQKIREKVLAGGLTKALIREAMPLTVTCYNRSLIEQIAEPLSYIHKGERQQSSYYILLSGHEDCYDKKTGLTLPDKQSAQNFIW